MTTTMKLSRECALMGKSRTATPSNIIRLRAAGRGAPNTLNGKVPPRRTPNKERRSREYLTASEVQALMDAARKTGRHGHRDATLILIAYRHGLRVSELVSLRWDEKADKITAAAFREYGEEEMAYLIENDYTEFQRRYEQGIKKSQTPKL